MVEGAGHRLEALGLSNKPPLGPMYPTIEFAGISNDTPSTARTSTRSRPHPPTRADGRTPTAVEWNRTSVLLGYPLMPRALTIPGSPTPSEIAAGHPELRQGSRSFENPRGTQDEY